MIHRIRRQVLDLELPREEGAVALQRQVGRVFQEKVLPLLDEVFSQIAPEGRIVRINRLEIDLGQLGESNWERDFVERCVTQVVKQVQEVALEENHPRETGVQILDVEKNALAIFQYFLETGVLPWYAKDLSLKTLEERIAVLVLENAEPLRYALLPVFQKKETAWQRLVWQFSEGFALMVVERVLRASAGWIRQAFEVLERRTGKPLDQKAKANLMQTFFHTSASGLFDQPPRLEVLISLFSGVQTGQIPSGRPTSTPPDSSLEPGLKEASPEEAPSDLSKSLLETPHATPEKPIAERKEPEVLAEGIPVELAGLALLGVYLPSLFDELNLTREDEFIDPEAQHRALHVLYHLVTGLENPEEPALAFPKVLCGMELDDPVPLNLMLTEREKEECQQLLQAAIRNWPALKNTSPDGLRTGFLQRKGLLSYREERHTWRLQVERQGQDLLLERLPWSISIIKFAWMEEMVAVEW